MSKIVRFNQLGGPEVLTFDELPVDEPKEGEVRLKVEAIGLNRAESMFMHGQYLEPPQLPARIGYEAAGVIEAVGPGVDTAWVGKRASTIPAFSMNQYGSVGEQVLMPVHAIAEYPASLSPAEGASIWMQYLTAYGGLIECANLTKGDFVLVTAASSSVGLAAIQIARAEGAISIATTRKAAKKAELLEFGADHVIATDDEDLAARVREITAGKGTRVAFDPVAGSMISKAADAAADFGIIIEYGALSSEPPMYPLVQALFKKLTIRAYWLIETTLDPARLERGKKYVYDGLAKGALHPRIARTFPFSETVEAYRYLESNAQVGKVVITVP